MDLTQEIETILNKMQKEKSQQLENQLMALLENADMLIPALLPFGTDPAMVAKIMNDHGKSGSLPNGVNPQPAMLHDQNNKLCFPVFTSKKELEKGDENKKYPLTLGLPYKSCVDIFMHEKSISCIVINPFSHNVKINYNREALENAKSENKEISQEELEIIALIQLETKLLPSRMYKDGQDFIDELNKRQGDFICEILAEHLSSSEQSVCPKEEIDVMTLDIRDDLELIRINMPAACQKPACAREMFIRWNPQTRTGEYYGIVQLKANEPAQVFLICEDGKQVNKGVAPEEGSELEYMIEL